MDLLYNYALHCAFHVARAWSNSKYEEILYHPSIYVGVGQRTLGEGGSSPSSQTPHRTATGIHWHILSHLCCQSKLIKVSLVP